LTGGQAKGFGNRQFTLDMRMADGGAGCTIGQPEHPVDISIGQALAVQQVPDLLWSFIRTRLSRHISLSIFVPTLPGRFIQWVCVHD
jgi:hypothetical protein